MWYRNIFMSYICCEQTPVFISTWPDVKDKICCSSKPPGSLEKQHPMHFKKMHLIKQTTDSAGFPSLPNDNSPQLQLAIDRNARIQVYASPRQAALVTLSYACQSCWYAPRVSKQGHGKVKALGKKCFGSGDGTTQLQVKCTGFSIEKSKGFLVGMFYFLACVSPVTAYRER